jgi:ABC-type Fe3+-hydroxamate transport system substrate-binding protein
VIELSDDLSRRISIPSPVQRIISLVPSITETLFSLGAGERIAGITDYCIHPYDGVCNKPKIGGTKNFHVERVLALKPDLVIANAEENRKHQVEKLEQAGIPVFVSFPKTVDGCLKMIADMAALSGTERAAQPILRDIDNARSDAAAHIMQPPPRVLCPIWKDPYMTINADTFIDSVIRASGGTNIFADSTERYPQFTIEEAARRRADVVILPTEPYHFTEADFGPFAALNRKIRIHVVEGELLSWYGPRLARALRVISKLLRSE